MYCIIICSPIRHLTFPYACPVCSYCSDSNAFRILLCFQRESHQNRADQTEQQKRNHQKAGMLRFGQRIVAATVGTKPTPRKQHPGMRPTLSVRCGRRRLLTAQRVRSVCRNMIVCRSARCRWHCGRMLDGRAERTEMIDGGLLSMRQIVVFVDVVVVAGIVMRKLVDFAIATVVAAALFALRARRPFAVLMRMVISGDCIGVGFPFAAAQLAIALTTCGALRRPPQLSQLALASPSLAGRCRTANRTDAECVLGAGLQTGHAVVVVSAAIDLVKREREVVFRVWVSIDVFEFSFNEPGTSTNKHNNRHSPA